MAVRSREKLKDFFDRKYLEFAQPGFIPADPISIPRMFRDQADMEIAGFFAAIFAWGNRTTIINKARELMQRMDMQPHAFCLHAGRSDLATLAGFKHRTFTEDDLLHFVEFFRMHYNQYHSLEDAFTMGMDPRDATIEKGLIHFRQYFFSGEHLRRTEKHISSPLQHSACKRINMFLRWMVRKDVVDPGIWKNIKPSQLVCPLDVHVSRVAKRFGLVSSAAANWATALELTENLKRLDPKDPVKYDLVLFSLGAEEKY